MVAASVSATADTKLKDALDGRRVPVSSIDGYWWNLRGTRGTLEPVQLKIELKTYSRPEDERFVSVEPHELLKDVLEGSGFLDPLYVVEIHFRHPDGRRRGRPRFTIAVTAAGEFWWLDPPYGSFGSVTLADLQRADSMGLTVFDESTTISIEEAPLYCLFQFGEILEGLIKIGEVWGGIYALKGAGKWIGSKLALGKARRDRILEHEIHWLAMLCRKKKDAWAAHGGFVADVLETILSMERWKSDTLRKGLGLRPDEADRLLRNLGYVYSPIEKSYVLSKKSADLTVRREVVQRVYFITDPLLEGQSSP